MLESFVRVLTKGEIVRSLSIVKPANKLVWLSCNFLCCFVLLTRATKFSLERWTASGLKPERGHCALEQSIGGSSEELRLHKNLKEFIPRSSEDFRFL